MGSLLAAVLLLLAVMAAAAWVTRHLYQNQNRSTDKRPRQTRLAVIETAPVTRGRRVILVRRDNVEHLLMIGGPTDVVIEPNIVRAAAAPREAGPPARAAETLPRAAARNETSGSWPLQPEPAAPARPLRGAPAEEPATWSAEPELPLPPRRQPRPADPLAGLAAGLTRTGEPRIPIPANPGGVGPREPREPTRSRETREIEREPIREPAREREPPRTREPQPPPAAAEEAFDPDADQDLADMAQRLDAALRRPGKGVERPPEGGPPADPGPAPTRAPAPSEASHARAAAKPTGSLYESLEREMASLRPGAPLKYRYSNEANPTNGALSEFEKSLSSPNNNRGQGSVDVGAFAPHSAQAGSVVLVQLILYPSGQRRRALSEARAADRDAIRRGAVTLSIDIEFGRRVWVVLEGNGLSIDDPARSLIWRNEVHSCQFWVRLANATTNITYQLRGRVVVDSVPVGTLCFTLTAVVDDANSPAKPEIRGDSAKRYQYAFLSYAAADRVEVLKRAQALKATRIGFFQDLLHLEPGERWQRRLFQEIDKCDLFLLFWSSSAARSVWVLKEAQYALHRSKSSTNQLPEITPIVLEGPPIPPPPDELAEIHFNDALRYVIAAAEN